MIQKIPIRKKSPVFYFTCYGKSPSNNDCFFDKFLGKEPIKTENQTKKQQKRIIFTINMALTIIKKIRRFPILIPGRVKKAPNRANKGKG